MYIKIIENKIAYDYICKNHYLHYCFNNSLLDFGIFDGNELVGVLMFRKSDEKEFAKYTLGKCTLLHRLHIDDRLPKNTASWAISRAIKIIKQNYQEIEYVFTRGDNVHTSSIGTCYKASNFWLIDKEKYEKPGISGYFYLYVYPINRKMTGLLTNVIV